MDTKQAHHEDAAGIIEADILVIGGGIGGMTVAAAAAQRKAVVAVIEIAEEIGGSALISRGYVSTPPSVDVFLHDDPLGNAERFGQMLDRLNAIFEWVGELGVWLSPPVQGVLGYCDGRQIDVADYFAATRRVVEGAGGFIVRKTRTLRLLKENGAVVGALCEDIDSGEKITLRAGATVLATGGFQASTEARRRYLPNSSQRFVARCSPDSQGDGSVWGWRREARWPIAWPDFYGHLMPYPAPPLKYSDFTSVAFYESPLGVLLERNGRRFCDESLGDHVNVQRVSEVDRAVLVVDEETRLHGMANFMPKGEGSEKWQAAASMGGNYLSAESLSELCAGVAAWGYDGAAALETLESFNAMLASDPEGMKPPRSRRRRALSKPPFHAVELQAGITFTYGGLRNDMEGRVLDAADQPVKGLFVAGVDAGGFSHTGYAGGLVRGLVFGRMVAEAALAARSALERAE